MNSVKEPVVTSKIRFVKPNKRFVVLVDLELIIESPVSSSVETVKTESPDVVMQGSGGIKASIPVE